MSEALPGTLLLGASGMEVAALQLAVGAEADGIYGPKTERAVADFQMAQSLGVDGIAGPQTWQALLGPETMLGPGSSDPQVVTAQRLLGIEPTGVFGPTTQKATVTFQREHGLVADGIIGRRTWVGLTASTTSGASSVTEPRRFVAENFSFSGDAARTDILNGAAKPHLVDALAWLPEHGAPRATIVAIAMAPGRAASGHGRAAGFGVQLVATHGEREIPALLHAISRNPYVHQVGLGGDYERFAGHVNGKMTFGYDQQNSIYIGVNVILASAQSERRTRIVPKRPRAQPGNARQESRLPPGFPHRDAILKAAEEYNVDPVLLAAVGEQESNMGNALNSEHRGDADACAPLGHGYGIWQLDDQRRPGMSGRPAALLDAVANDPGTAAKVAAAMLRDNLQARSGNVREALQMYNAGSPYALGTARVWPDGKLYYADSVLRFYHAISNGSTP